MHRVAAAADEMMATLVKTAYSPNIKERRDCSVAIFDAGGQSCRAHRNRARFSAHIQAETAKWAEVIRTSGVHME